ncbi:hypothetical protein B0H17DRAFT_1149097, partial [Mycena rosella]
MHLPLPPRIGLRSPADSKNNHRRSRMCPLPLIKGAFGTAVIFLETVENQIQAQGDSGASRFKKLCEDLEKFLSEVQDRVQLLQKQPKGFRERFKEVVKLRSTADEISKYGKRINELRLNFVLATTMGIYSHLAKALPIGPPS